MNAEVKRGYPVQEGTYYCRDCESLDVGKAWALARVEERKVWVWGVPYYREYMEESDGEWLGPFTAKDVLAGMLVRDDAHTCRWMTANTPKSNCPEYLDGWEDGIDDYCAAIAKAATQDTADDGS